MGYNGSYTDIYTQKEYQKSWKQQWKDKTFFTEFLPAMWLGFSTGIANLGLLSFGFWFILIGGVMSVSWHLDNINECNPKVKYSKYLWFVYMILSSYFFTLINTNKQHISIFEWWQPLLIVVPYSLFTLRRIKLYKRNAKCS